MLCSEFDAQVQELLDLRQPLEQNAGLLQHAGQCTRCSHELATLACLFDSLDLLEMPEMSDDFAQRVLASVTTEPDQIKRPASLRVSHSMPVASVLAAALVLALIPVTWRWIDGNSPSIAQPSAHDANVPGRQSPHPPAPLASVADSNRQGWIVSTSLLELYPEETRERHRQQVNELADDLRPITTPFNAALTAIRRTLPGGRSEGKGEPRASIERPQSSRTFS